MDNNIVINGIFSVIFISISIIIGIKITLSYRHNKEKIYLSVGLVWILITESWFASAISFLIALFTNTTGLQQYPQVYLLIGNLLIPINQLIWLSTTTDLFYKQKQKLIVGIYACFTIIFEVLFIYYAFNDYTAIGNVVSIVDVEYEPLFLVWIAGNLLVFLIPGFLFGRATMKSNKPEIKLKGRLLIVAFCLFGVGAALDSASIMPAEFLPLTRSILITSALFYYGGFILPNWMKKLLIKGQTEN
ncbi:MAG: hypothetical protein ACFFAS_08445 [Promethearchaeota archaeon]